MDRNALLAHALVHDERFLFEPGTPAAVVQHEEHQVLREVARRLVPLDQLNDYVTTKEDLEEPVTATDVAHVFEVPEHVARRALHLLVGARDRGRNR